MPGVPNRGFIPGLQDKIAEQKRLDALKGTVDANGVYTPLTMGTGSHAASEAVATVTRNKYEDWKTRFFPNIDELMQMTTYNNPALVDQEINKAVNTTNQTFNNVAGSQQRNLARYGMTQTAEQKAADASALELGRSAATVNAANQTRLALQDRDRAIATGGLSA